MQAATCSCSQRTPCEIFSRSMGFIRPVSNFNIGKYSEFCERKTFTEQNSLTTGARHSELMKKAACWHQVAKGGRCQKGREGAERTWI